LGWGLIYRRRAPLERTDHRFPLWKLGSHAGEALHFFGWFTALYLSSRLWLAALAMLATFGVGFWCVLRIRDEWARFLFERAELRPELGGSESEEEGIPPLPPPSGRRSLLRRIPGL